MPPPADVLEAAQRLSDIYRTALDHIRADLAAAGTEPNKTRLRKRLRDLERTITQRMAEVNQQAQFWIDDTLPLIYSRGMGSFVIHTAAVTDTPTSGVLVDFTMPSRPAVERLASGLTDDLLSATREVERAAKRKIRQFVSDASMSKILEGRSLRDAQKQVATALDGLGLDAIRYANGTAMPLDGYADMAVRSVTANAYNGGLVDAGRANGVEWYECFDSDDCGLDGHDDEEKPNGQLYPADVVEEFSISHPNCVRSWGPRPDVTSEEEAADADPIGEDLAAGSGLAPVS
jgi:hypothetical protein